MGDGAGIETRRRHSRCSALAYLSACFGLILAVSVAAIAEEAVAPADPSAIVSQEISPYRFEGGALHYMDLLTLTDGSQRLGKAMEWADKVLVFEEDGRAAVFDVRDVTGFELRRFKRHKVKPDLPDLTVAYIERLPRDPSMHGHLVRSDGYSRLDIDAGSVDWRPRAGSEVVFKVHVLNAGAVDSLPVPCRVLIDGVEIASLQVGALAPGAEATIDASWKWQEGRHIVRVEVDAEGTTAEIVRWNNTFEDEVQALGVAIVVPADRYEEFFDHRNMVDSFCVADWIQHHIRMLNAIFKRSTSPSAPEGILERLRCDRIIVVRPSVGPDKSASWQSQLRQGGQAGGLVEYAAMLEFGEVSDGDAPEYDALRTDWRQFKVLGLQLGLVDLAATDTQLDQCLATDRFGRFVQRRHLFPWPRTMMYLPGGHLFTESEAAYLNKVLGQPRGFSGEYLFRVPSRVTIALRTEAGMPIEGVQVDVYQLQSEGEFAGYIAGVSPGDPLYAGRTDADGRFTLVNQPAPDHRGPGGYPLRPNPFGKIATDGSNGLLLLKLTQDAAESFQFVRLVDCNVAYLRGSQDEMVIPIQVPFGAGDAPPAPVSTAANIVDSGSLNAEVSLIWIGPHRLRNKLIDEFRVYKRSSFGGEDANPWRLSSIMRRSEMVQGWRLTGTYFDSPSENPGYSLDTFFATSVVDIQGRASSISAPACLVHDKEVVKFAVHQDEAFMTLAGGGEGRMLHWDGQVATQPFGLRNLTLKGYKPAVAGLAITSDHRLVVTDPVNHVLAFYSAQGLLEDVFPRRKWWPGYASDEPGEFYMPFDVALDPSGQMYVADYGNNRVQILDSAGGFKGLLDEGFRFEGPHAIAYGNGHICVTDRDGTRCRVYDVRRDSPMCLRELPALVDADRALVARSGNIYITGRIAAGFDPGLLVYSPSGETAKFERSFDEAQMGTVRGPRSLYLYVTGMNEDYGYFVNQFPFDVRRQLLE